jgi:hypothetical protein
MWIIDIFKSPRRIQFFLIVTGYLFSLLAIFLVKESPILAYLYLYIPMLWLGWIIVAFKTKGRLIFSLFYSWLLIDCMMLLVIGYQSIGVHDFCQSKGIDQVLFVSYFPIIMPVSLFFYYIPELTFEFSSVFGCTGLIGAFSVWLEITLVALIQSTIIVILLRVFLR